ncbi:MAG: hypothetical protein COY38_03315 [Candidatus Aenigmarchaeota archaeon CG_4_10_14_0_8_um_filter_37_24]|nr:MAG: hypothetical protein COS07_01455 [Candidatus Aenigmarchaeota archaeon CG01_land_8_20_14_3_00_37_9]PIW41511.1 MAG: hypothetical protein COW21_01280 [Candidatus Aenigmarchaeota archaeon CG15_BIG_FIL_POST_REV_8_21_14_020_37_27]PIX51055.1 MAG: hypothetical protein COZ52_00620 [Candidatus Aenigmarchaeota archaeon CG_4_8_14_3_um_filter_37_24]PIY35864.1 MAG: hypothetical protein COZ04_02050 [Candidatus Aenigmarchaeota archaeon CG_4_10_14_3_um_filter_37_21]PIZ35025.1 MAG: hypothetical protein C
MKWKKFFNPKIIFLFLVLFLLSSLIPSFRNYIIFEGGLRIPNELGFPLIFYELYLCPPWVLCATVVIPPKFLIFNFIVDVVFWYLIACLIFWVYKKVKR